MGPKNSDGRLFAGGRMARRRSPTRLPSPLFISAEQREVIFSRKGEPPGDLRPALTCANDVNFPKFVDSERSSFVPYPSFTSARHPECEFKEREGSWWLVMDNARAKRSSCCERQRPVGPRCADRGVIVQ